MRSLSAIFLVLLALIAAPASLGDVPTMSFDEVQPGMKGQGRTSFSSTEVTSFDVEILGKLPNVGPDQDLILARCSGGPLEETGVLAGMSGSPVTIDGKLVGAIAYSWGFAKAPIAGITPIGEMLRIRTLDGEEDAIRTAGPLLDGTDLRRLVSAEAPAAFLTETLVAPLRRPVGALPLSTPLSVAGIGASGLSAIDPLLSVAGFVPIQTGGGGGEARPTPPLEPGSPVGVKLVRGDLELTATGTVTWVEGSDVLAFGHPLFSLGDVDLPLTGATVQTLLPSLMQSARFATPLAEIGALRQDRASGILGRLDTRPSLIPVRFKLVHPVRGEREYSFDIADDAMLSPLLLYVSLNGILQSKEPPIGQATVRLREGSVIKMADGQDVKLDNLFSGPQALDYGTGIPAYVLYLLMNNAWARPDIAGVNLILEYDSRPQTARIRRVSLDRYRVRAGDTVSTAVVLAPFRGPDRIIDRTILVPEETPPGKLTLHVGSAIAVSQAEEPTEPVFPRDLEQLILLINRLRRNDRVYIAATREDSGVLLAGSRLPNLPPSVANVLTRPKSRGNLLVLPRRLVLEETIETEYAVDGSATLELEVEAP
jgi:hypothetical protein